MGYSLSRDLGRAHEHQPAGHRGGKGDGGWVGECMMREGGREVASASPATLCKDEQQSAGPPLKEEREIGKARRRWPPWRALNAGHRRAGWSGDRRIGSCVPLGSFIFHCHLPAALIPFRKAGTSHTLPLQTPTSCSNLFCTHIKYIYQYCLFLFLEWNANSIPYMMQILQRTRVKGPWLSGSPRPSRATPTGLLAWARLCALCHHRGTLL